MKSSFAIMLVAAVLAASARGQDELISLDAPMNSTIISTQWVQPDAAGAISGRVVLPSGDATDFSGEVFMTAQKAEPVAAAVSPTGEFVFTDVKPGVYTLVYQSENAFAAYALQVVAPQQDSALSSTTLVSATSLNPRMALTTIARYQPPRVGNAMEIGGVRTATTGAGPATASIMQVARNSTGGLSGQLIQAGSTGSGLTPASKVNVIVLKNGRSVAQAISDDNGRFEIAGLELGAYDLIASGMAGFAAIGFELVDSIETLTSLNATAQGGDAASTLVLQVAPPDPGLLVGPPAPSDDDDAFGPPLPMEGTIPPPGVGGGFAGPAGGGFGGGGFGGGGFGGIGGLGGLAAIGAVLAATLSDDDNDGNFVPRPSSPSVP